MGLYGYDYFCGANIYVNLNGIPAVEIAGISYQVQDSTSPIYGYNPTSFKEDDYLKCGVIAVMAVDNLPCELPKDASIYFGKELLEKVIPKFFNDLDGVIKRGTITRSGILTEKFKYLKDFIS